MKEPQIRLRRTDTDDSLPDFSFAYRLSVPLWVFDIDQSRILAANDSACGLWAAETEAELCARDFCSDMSSTVAKRLRQYQRDFTNGDPSFSELWTLYPQGEPRSVMVKFRGYRLPDNRMAMLCEAITEPTSQPENVRSAEALLHTDVMITLFADRGAPLYSNPAARNAQADTLATFADLFVKKKDFEKVTQGLQRHGEFRDVARVHTSVGERWYDLSAKHCSDAATGQPAVLLTAIDVTELTEARDTARHLADRDQLTGLYNRAFLQTHLTRLTRSQVADTCALIFCDIDRFKQINDRYGHDAGDGVLREVAHRMRTKLRRDDVVARLGGDEIVVLLENVATLEDVERRTRQLRRAVSEPFHYAGSEFEIAISAGIAMFAPNASDFNEVLRQADLALYASKQAGRNRATVFTHEMGIAAKTRDDLEVALKEAILKDQFVLHFQPRLDIKSGKIVAIEGLVRWTHPERGVVMPNAFIPLCEETGLIRELGCRVMEMGVAQAIDWHKAGLDINVSLNASPRQFGDGRMIETLSSLSALPDFPSGKIEIEITENVLSGDQDRTAEQLMQISDMGYRIAIDDFGTGYSNLSSISRFPVTCLKIDKSFIAKLPETDPVLKLIIMLGRQLGVTVVCEGVETSEQLDWLAQQNCDQAQGYLITEPLPPRELSALLQARTR